VEVGERNSSGEVNEKKEYSREDTNKNCYNERQPKSDNRKTAYYLPIPGRVLGNQFVSIKKNRPLEIEMTTSRKKKPATTRMQGKGPLGAFPLRKLSLCCAKKKAQL